jgi:hypothetical protein
MTNPEYEQAMATLRRVAGRPWAPIVITDADVLPKPAKRRRTPNLTRYIKQARKAGDRGAVRVEVTDSKGRTVVVTSEPSPAQHTDAARTMWDKKLATN